MAEREGGPDHRGHVISYDEQEDSHTVRWLDAAGAAEQWLGYISASAGIFLAARYIPAFYSSTAGMHFASKNIHPRISIRRVIRACPDQPGAAGLIM